jgi:hypothetical protein
VTMSRPKIRCSGCRKRIPDHEPDVVLRRLEGGIRRYYHTRCTGAALELVTETPAAWRMTVCYVEEMAN